MKLYSLCYRPPQSGGDNGPSPHKQGRTALSPPTSRAAPNVTSVSVGGYASSPYVSAPSRDTVLGGYSPYSTIQSPNIYHRTSPAHQQQQQQSQSQTQNEYLQRNSTLRVPPPQSLQQQSQPPEQHVVRSLPPPQQSQQQPSTDHLRTGIAPEHMRVQQQPTQAQQQLEHRLLAEHVRNSQEVIKIEGVTREQLTQSQMRPRISLLPTSDYLSAQNMAKYAGRDMYRGTDNTVQQGGQQVLGASANMIQVGGHVQLDMSNQPAFKKIRLGEQKPDITPLRIDTRVSYVNRFFYFI